MATSVKLQSNPAGILAFASKPHDRILQSRPFLRSEKQIDQRTKCQRYHRCCCCELEPVGDSPAPQNHPAYRNRANGCQDHRENRPKKCSIRAIQNSRSIERYEYEIFDRQHHCSRRRQPVQTPTTNLRQKQSEQHVPHTDPPRDESRYSHSVGRQRHCIEGIHGEVYAEMYCHEEQ